MGTNRLTSNKAEFMYCSPVTEREQPFDTAFSRTLGLDPRRMRYLGIKIHRTFSGKVFESWAGAIHAVSEPSAQAPAGSDLQFHKPGAQTVSAA